MKYDTLNYCYKKTFLSFKEVIIKSSNLGNSVYNFNGVPCFLSFNNILTKDYKCCEVYNIKCNNYNIGYIYLFKEIIFVKFCNKPYLFYYDKLILPIVLKKYKRFL